jgi:hypothetical protein
MKLATKVVAGREYTSSGVRELVHHAAVHHDDALRERHRLDLVVRDEEGGDAQLAVQLLDFHARLRAQLGVQVRQRFVEQKHLWLPHDRAAHGHALALAAGELAGLAFEQVAQFEDAWRPCPRAP